MERVKMGLKKAKFGCRGLLLLAILIVFLPSIMAVSVSLVKNTAFCFDCETIYQICKDSSMTTAQSAISFDFYKPGAIKDSNFASNIFLGNSYTYIEQKPEYGTRTISGNYPNGTAFSYDETYITKINNVTMNGYNWIPLNLADAATAFKTAAIGTCWNISIRGKLKPNQAIDNIMTIGTTSYTQYAWWNSSWLYKRQISLNSTSPETLTDFPAAIVVNTASLIAAGKMQNDCDDVRFLNSSELTLDYETESCNTAVTTFWVRIPSYTANTTVNITMYYGNPAAPNAQNVKDVWRNDFVSVWHGVGPADTLGWNNFTTASITIATNASCKYGSCFAFLNATANLFTTTSLSRLPSGSGTSTQSGWGVLSNNATTPGIALVAFGNHATGAERRMLFNEDAGEVWVDTYGVGRNPPDARHIDMNVMGYYGATHYNSTCGYILYQIQPGQSKASTHSPNSCNTAANSHLGIGISTEGFNQWGQGGTPAYIDEVRISNVSRTAGWMTAEYGTTFILGNEQVNAVLTFDSIIPSNLTSLNVITKKVNITYNFTGMNGTFFLSHRTNGSTPMWRSINGTSLVAPNNLTHSCSNTSTQVKCQLDDNDILPGTYSIDPETMETTTHVVLGTLGSLAEYYKIGLNNVTCAQYGFFEIMTNGTSPNNYQIYFCNSSYTTGNPTTVSSCTVYATLNNTQQFNHSHDVGYSKHHVIPFSVSAAGCKINTVAVTPKSFFLVRGGSNTQIWGINANSDPINMQRSDNNGATWSNNIGVTADAHLHQFDQNSLFYYRGCGYSSTDSSLVCDSERTDLLELDYIPPAQPIFLQSIPEVIRQNASVLLNWSSVADPNGFAISYNFTLLDNLTYADNGRYNTNATSYNFTASKPIGNYLFRIYAYDTAGLVSSSSDSSSFKICVENYTCSSYADCTINNLTACLAVTDYGCGYTFTGNLSDYNGVCTYLYVTEPPSLTTIDLTLQQNVIMFGLFLFFWIALGVLTFTFKNFLYGSMMFFVGVLLGFWAFSISWILSAMFLLFSSLFMFKTAKFK